MGVSAFALGLLAHRLFHLGFVDAILVCFFFNALGVLPVCLYSRMGARFGLRQIVISRYFFGWHGIKLIAVFDVLSMTGWSALNSLVSAQLIRAVNDNIPAWACILIIAFGTLIVTFFGYDLVHLYEYWGWIPVFIVFLITLGCFANSKAFVKIPMGVGLSEIGSCLSFGSVCRIKIFMSTWTGLMFSLCFVEMLGIAIMTATTTNVGDNAYAAGYTATLSGGLLGTILFPNLGGFGKFCVVVLALSIIASNTPNIYSLSVAMQAFGGLVGTVAYVAVAIPAHDHFESVLANFMNFIAYWVAMYEGVALAEHFVYRQSSMRNYDPEIHNQPSKLPPGFAGVFAFCCGFGGMVCGMSQGWYIGPIALYAGAKPFGGDVGFELAFAFSFVTYTIARWVEFKYSVADAV
ncbi:hypothetical protein M011DRAFT_522609 [Sporormia fimetaria CBS 119925]|uniref:Purine-cytosine permease n=1 Tax=Sporormia fimetaria CBS 119925 TaxID=1340428 RepID=A0A6A6UX03_9PLEO|nr:hypothetical protein M011DRAFT_522609 [Sporormia fimetaria CBS 119925]